MEQIRLTGRNALHALIPEKNESRETDKDNFSERLSSAVKEVNTMQHTADDAAEQVVLGSLGVHEGMLVMQEADISLKLLMQVRAKVIDAYKEVIRMPV